MSRSYVHLAKAPQNAEHADAPLPRQQHNNHVTNCDHAASTLATAAARNNLRTLYCLCLGDFVASRSGNMIAIFRLHAADGWIETAAP
jgi:hypothetical protein